MMYIIRQNLNNWELVLDSHPYSSYCDLANVVII